MLAKILHNNIVNTILLLLLATGAFLTMFPPDFLKAKWLGDHAAQVMLGYLGLGVFFLFIKQQRLLFTSFFCCAALCIFLKISTNAAVTTAVESADMPIFKIAHFNMNSAVDSLENALQTIEDLDTDILSFQEVTPFWKIILEDRFSKKYPYAFTNPDAGVFGMSIFSKLPIDSMGLFMYKEIPNISGIVRLPNETTFHFVSSHTFPDLNYTYLNRLREQLDTVAHFCSNDGLPTITFGDYHVVPWSNEIQQFREKTQLKDSRRGFMPTVPHGATTILEEPKDHILFSDDFECLKFETISSIATTHLGIQATFQLKPSDVDIKRPAE